jgi:hypothetical protein
VPTPLADLLGLCLAHLPSERPVDFGVVLRYLGHVEATTGYGFAGDRGPARGPKAPAEQPGNWEERRPPAAVPSSRAASRTNSLTARRSSRTRDRGRIPPWLVGVLVTGGVLTLLGIVLLAVVLSRSSRPNTSVGSLPPSVQANHPSGWEPHPAKPLPAELKPMENDPEDVRVYLSDLEEFAVRPTPMLWHFGKHGHMGSPFQDMRVSFNGWVSEKGLSTHPTDKYAGAKYRIDPAEVFETWVGISDSSGEEGSRAPIIFKVLGDGKELWTSEPVSKIGRFPECRVSVRGVKVLELRACPPEGSVAVPHGGHAVWLDPYVTRPKP